VLAGWATLVLVLLFSGAFAELMSSSSEEDEMILGIIFLVFYLGPATAGVACSIAAMGRQRPRPLLPIIGVVWNALLLGIFLLFVLIGLFA